MLFGAMSKEINTFVSEIIGDVAQLARALDWQSRGRRFGDSDLPLLGSFLAFELVLMLSVKILP